MNCVLLIVFIYIYVLPCHAGFNGMLWVSAQNATKDLSGVHHQEHTIRAHPLCCVGKAPLQVSGHCLCATASSLLFASWVLFTLCLCWLCWAGIAQWYWVLDLWLKGCGLRPWRPGILVSVLPPCYHRSSWKITVILPKVQVAGYN